MQTANSNDWRNRCKSLGLDPQEVKAVSRRYDMYRRYTDERGGDTLALERWYKWYRVEKLSEGHAMRTAPAPGCSVQAAAGTTGPTVSEQAFLELLQMYRKAHTPAGEDY